MLLKIRIHGRLAWESICLTVRLPQPLGNQEAADLHEAVMRWYEAAVTGRYGGHARFLVGPNYLDREVTLRANLGTAGEEAFNALLKIIEDWSIRDLVKVDDVVVGEPEEEDGAGAARR